jgi:hypothetical protein
MIVLPEAGTAVLRTNIVDIEHLRKYISFSREGNLEEEEGREDICGFDPF